MVKEQCSVTSGRIELPSKASETSILSIELRGRACKYQKFNPYSSLIFILTILVYRCKLHLPLGCAVIFAHLFPAFVLPLHFTVEVDCC